MDKLRRALSGNDQCDEESGIITQADVDFVVMDQSTLSWSTRIKGFAICFIIGILCSFLGSFALFLHKGLPVFAAFYTLGNIISLTRIIYEGWFQRMVAHPRSDNICELIFFTSMLILLLFCSTCFLMGPCSQLKKMFAATRIFATIVMFVAIALTLFSALHLGNAGLALLFIIIQSLAMTWYSLSYIPYARDAVKKTVESCIA